jgi:hypothetical protein
MLSRLVLIGMSGLQTPRLKRLAEIVSAHAMAQQEKLETVENGVPSNVE